MPKAVVCKAEIARAVRELGVERVRELLCTSMPTLLELMRGVGDVPPRRLRALTDAMEAARTSPPTEES